MDNDKPFKTIEVIDSKTNQICKVACMSCIRGHRTTSCGIQVCRSKIFWTVKRPGRPSNSCTCRYGSTGGCKCVVARAACPHKVKKGEKRSGECRCEESGRYCCLIEAVHWNELLSLRKPTIDFFHSREALESRQAEEIQASLMSPLEDSSIRSPPPAYSMPNSPASPDGMQSMCNMSGNYHSFQSPLSSIITPRFGMMGIGAPMGSQNHAPDVLVWQGEAPTAPREFKPMHDADQSEQMSCCGTSTRSSQSIQPLSMRPEQKYTQSQEVSALQPFHSASGTVSMAQLSPAPFDMDKVRMDYLQHQFPGSICQNCGLSGCTCRNCPPIFQNFSNTSWAQCCGRKHARDAPPLPLPRKAPRLNEHERQENRNSNTIAGDGVLLSPFLGSGTLQQYGNTFGDDFDVTLQQPTVTSGFSAFDGGPELNHDFALPDGAELLDLDQFLMSDFDRPQHQINTGPIPAAEADRESEVEEADAGCCCGGG